MAYNHDYHGLLTSYDTPSSPVTSHPSHPPSPLFWSQALGGPVHSNTGGMCDVAEIDARCRCRCHRKYGYTYIDRSIDRSIDRWINRYVIFGNHAKTWLSQHLGETLSDLSLWPPGLSWHRGHDLAFPRSSAQGGAAEAKVRCAFHHHRRNSHW